MASYVCRLSCRCAALRRWLLCPLLSVPRSPGVSAERLRFSLAWACSSEFGNLTLEFGLITHSACVPLVLVLFRLMWGSCSPEVLAAVRLAVGARHRPPPLAW